MVGKFISHNPIILADYREEKSGIDKLLKKQNVIVKFQQLTIGDYIISGEYVIERKTARDFVQSIFDGRLFDQANRLASVSKFPTFIIENPFSTILNEVKNINSIFGALIALSYSYRMHIFYSENIEQTATILAVIAKHGKYEYPLEPIFKIRKKAETLKEKQELIVSSIPGIGSKTAKKLLEKFGSLKAIFTASPAQLSKINGLSIGKAIKIYRLINAQYPYSKKEN